MTRPQNPTARPRPFTVDGARGEAYEELPQGTGERMSAWLQAGTVAEGEPIKPGRVYRVDEWIVKFFEYGGALRDYLRPSPATRSARRHVKLQELGAPRPIATLEQRRGPSILVMEHIRGITLPQALEEENGSALEAFPKFMADMHRRRVFHGDLHVAQMLFDGHRWCLLDLDGLRHMARRLRVRPLVHRQWVRMFFDLGRNEAVENLFRSYHSITQSSLDPDAAWAAIVRAERRTPGI